MTSPELLTDTPQGDSSAEKLASGGLAASLPVTVIEATRGWRALRLREIWEHRELLYFLAWRNIKVRYKQAALGVTWVVIQPIVSALLYFLIVNGLRAGFAKPERGNVAGPSFGFLHIFVAMLLWQMFSSALTRCAGSLVNSANLLTKIYFPRLIIPIAAVLVGLVDFLISFVVLALMMVGFHTLPGWPVLLLPAFVLLAFFAALGTGLWLSALNVRYRDVTQIVPFLVQIWMLASPVIYSIETIMKSHMHWRILYFANPMVEVICGFRWTLLGGAPPAADITPLVGRHHLALLISGLWYFIRTEHYFADIV